MSPALHEIVSPDSKIYKNMFVPRSLDSKRHILKTPGRLTAGSDLTFTLFFHRLRKRTT